MVQTKACNDTAQERFRLPQRFAIGIEPTKERFLDHIFGVCHGSQHSVGDADQFGTHWVQRGGGVAIRHPFYYAAARSFTGCRPGKPIWRRFHPLMVTINNVSFTAPRR